MSARGRNLAKELAECKTPRECVRLMLLLEEEHANDIKKLRDDLGLKSVELASRLLALAKTVEELEKKLADPMDSEQSMDEPIDLAAAPSTANGRNHYPWETPDGPLPDNVKVGAIWGKRKNPQHEILIESIIWDGETSVGTHRRVNGRRSWHQKYNGPISVTTLLAEYVYSRVSHEYAEETNKSKSHVSQVLKALASLAEQADVEEIATVCASTGHIINEEQAQSGLYRLRGQGYASNSDNKWQLTDDGVNAVAERAAILKTLATLTRSSKAEIKRQLWRNNKISISYKRLEHHIASLEANGDIRRTDSGQIELID
jgi:DNA-binding transcriptional regulator YiaG